MKSQRTFEKRRCIAAFLAGVARLSTCKRFQHACVIVDSAITEIHAFGFNGVPLGIRHDLCDGAADPCVCVHAEANALIKLRRDIKSATLIVTTSPCVKCAGLIINSRAVDIVVVGNAAHASMSTDTGAQMLNDAGIAVVCLESWTRS